MSCTFEEAVWGVPAGECGQPATSTVTWVCDHGHEITSHLCAPHVVMAVPDDGIEISLADLLAQVDVYCPTCAEAGDARERLHVVEVTAYDPALWPLPVIPGQTDLLPILDELLAQSAAEIFAAGASPQ